MEDTLIGLMLLAGVFHRVALGEHLLGAELLGDARRLREISGYVDIDHARNARRGRC